MATEQTVKPSMYHSALPDDAPKPSETEIVNAAQTLLDAVAAWVCEDESAWLRDVLPDKDSKSYSFVSSLWLIVHDGGKI